MAMQERLAAGPHAALGVATTATVSEIRTAFLELTKTYHPARFGYMSSELQRLSNEVFLSLRAAHDVLARPARAQAASKLDRSGSYLRNDRSGSYPLLPQTLQAPPPTTTQAPQAPQTLQTPQASQVPQAVPVAQRTERSGGVAVPSPHAPAGTATAPHAAGAPPARPTPTPATRSAAPALATSRATPSAGMRAGAMRPASASATPPSAVPALALRPGLARPPSAPPGGARPEERELAAALEQLHRGQWDAARALLSMLAARAPDVPRYRALLAYARGREAQLAQRLDEARVELQHALQIDPELALAKTALAELFTRRK
ncbi:MAG TPA: hypothetical protein VNO30_09730 [Kofleriaceae bacterium]|nr:hypothetical protein [Kofleriaceae bacterium]